MMAAIFVALVACAALAFVVSPLRKGPRSDDVTTSEVIEEAGARKRSALMAILDMEEEKAVGKLSDVDFQVLRSQYEAEAVAALKELDAVRTEDQDAEIEAEIARLKDAMVCANCGAIMPEGARCSACNVS